MASIQEVAMDDDWKTALAASELFIVLVGTDWNDLAAEQLRYATSLRKPVFMIELTGRTSIFPNQTFDEYTGLKRHIVVDDIGPEVDAEMIIFRVSVDVAMFEIPFANF